MSKHLSKSSAGTKETEKIGESTMIANDEIAEYLDFSNLAQTFISLTKGVKLIDPFFAKEIEIFVPSEDLAWDDSVEFAKIASIPKNKPLNILLYWSSMKNLKGSELEARKVFFDVKVDVEKSAKSYAKLMKSYVFMIMLLYTRGSVPSSSLKNQTNSLPKLLVNNLDMDSKAVEQDFAEMFASVDIRKIDLTPFLDISPKNLPTEIKNRIKLGFAGSRILKLFVLAKSYYKRSDQMHPTNSELLFEMMVEISSAGTVYKNAHPLIQIVQSSIPGFYVKMLCLIAENVEEENWDSFLRKVKKIPSFAKDQKLNNLVFTDGIVDVTFDQNAEGYADLNVNSLKKSYGTLMDFN